MGIGCLMSDGETGRPLGMLIDRRRASREGFGWETVPPAEPTIGTSRMLSVRPVVGSLVELCAGSCETW